MKTINLLIFLSLFCTKLYSYQLDSIGVVIENGMYYVLHKVEPGESIFKLQVKYDVKATLIKEANNLPSYDVFTEQVVKIPKYKVELNNPILHEVKAGESFYSIAKKYGVSINNIFDFNQMKEYNLVEGKKLIVGYEACIPKKDEIINSDFKPKNEFTKSATSSSALESVYYDKIFKKEVKVISEIGEIQMTWDVDIKPSMLTVFHNALPIGSLVEITHPITGRSVFAEVVGKMKVEGVILQASPKVFKYLGLENKKSLGTTIYYRAEQN